ncbi:phosphonate ABC transporter ATP-binding protein [Rubritalea tangerina]|uniref:Phosphonate ABC transporter ATP-binding protein n=1 Tax=Rubritalea tangerina TaxID=430798 RepID=A0ABW4ZFM7_9BACT
MLNLYDANLSFGSTHVLRDLSLEIARGEKVALIGPSGSGKSSLLKTIASEYLLDSGSLSIQQQSISSLSNKALKELRCSIAYIPQDLALVENLKVHQNVLLGKVGSQKLLQTLLYLSFAPKAELQSVLDILSEVGIPEKIFHRTDSLSGGQQQRVAIARALYQKASLILADEPVSAVDPSRAHSLLECLTSLAEKNKVTLLCSLHNLDYAKTFFPRIIGMREGNIIFDGKSEDFSEKDFAQLYSLDHG